MDRTDTTMKPSYVETDVRRPPLLRYGWLVYLAMGIQVLAFVMADQIEAGAMKILLVTSYVVVAPVLFINLKRPGIVLIFAGVLLNFLVIVVNGGAMPVDPNAYGLEAVYAQEVSSDYLPWSKGVLKPVEDARLWVLGDIFFSPGPFRVIYSLGDVLIFAGMLVYLASLTGLGKYLKRLIL